MKKLGLTFILLLSILSAHAQFPELSAPKVRSSCWLGDGWSLSTGPSLSRSIAGGADEYFYNSTIAETASPTWYQLSQVTSQAADVTLDEYNYSLLGSAGKENMKSSMEERQNNGGLYTDSIALFGAIAYAKSLSNNLLIPLFGRPDYFTFLKSRLRAQARYCKFSNEFRIHGITYYYHKNVSQ